MKTLVVLLFLSLVTAQNKTYYENYSWDYSAHKMPIAYTSHGNAVEMHHFVKLNNKIPSRGGAYTLDRPVKSDNFEVDIEFTIMSDLEKARGFEIFLTEHE